MQYARHESACTFNSPFIHTMSSTLPPYLTASPPPISPPTTVRLQALYASTSSQRQSNPTGYSANVSWWSGVIEELLRAGYLGDDHLVLKVDESLLGRLEWNGGKPRGIGGFVVCLTEVLRRELICRNDYQPLQSLYIPFPPSCPHPPHFTHPHH